MGDDEASYSNSPLMQSLANYNSFFFGKDYGLYGIMGAVILGLILPLVFSLILMGKNRVKQRGVKVEVGGDTGIAMRNYRFPELVRFPWEGATTLAALFEQSCKKHAQDRFLGTRKLIERSVVTSNDGRKFEKLHLGEYEWQTYEQAFVRACNFASGLVKLGHHADSRAAIFSETRAEWIIAFQVVKSLFVIILVYVYLYFFFPSYEILNAHTEIIQCTPFFFVFWCTPHGGAHLITLQMDHRHGTY